MEGHRWRQFDGVEFGQNEPRKGRAHMESQKPTIILALALLLSLVLFGIGMFGFRFGEEKPEPVIDKQQAPRLVQTQFPGARILEIELDAKEGKRSMKWN
jgi:hypothetical protein